METLAIGTLASTKFGHGIIGRLPYAKRGPGTAYIVRMVDGEHEGRELCFFAPSDCAGEEWPFAPLVHGPEEDPFTLDLCEECHAMPKWNSLTRLCESCYNVAISEIRNELAKGNN